MKRLFTILAIVLPLCLQAQVSTTRPSAFTEAIGKRPSVSAKGRLLPDNSRLPVPARQGDPQMMVWLK